MSQEDVTFLLVSNSNDFKYSTYRSSNANEEGENYKLVHLHEVGGYWVYVLTSTKQCTIYSCSDSQPTVGRQLNIILKKDAARKNRLYNNSKRKQLFKMKNNPIEYYSGENAKKIAERCFIGINHHKSRKIVTTGNETERFV